MFMKSIWIGFIGVMLFVASGIGRALVVGADDPLTQYNVACGYTKLGDIKEALDLLERMLPKVGEEIKMWIKHDSDFEALHGNPRFQRLLKSIT
jgi:adenylate cyclase